MTKHYYNCLLLALGIGVGYFYTLGWGYYLVLGLLFVGLLSWGVFDIRPYSLSLERQSKTAGSIHL